MTFIKKSKLGDMLSTHWYSYAVRRTGVPMPNCFTYACARISELLGKEQPLDAQRVRGAGDLWEGHANEFINQSTPKQGALMIWKGGVGNYGHVAVCEAVIDSSTIEWSESNYGGAMFRIVQQNPNQYAGLKFMGYLYHKELNTQSIPTSMPKDEQRLNSIPSDFVYENAMFYCGVNRLNIRRAPSLAGELTGDWYENTSSVHYDGYVKREGYVWISWIGRDGTRRWMAAGELDVKGINRTPYGTFH